MAHDGQNQILTETTIVDDLLGKTEAAIAPVEALLDKAKDAVRMSVVIEGRVSGAAVEANQTACHGLAWLATYVESLRQMLNWAKRLDEDGKFGEMEQLIHQIAFGEYLHQLAGGIPMNQGEFLRPADLGLGWDALGGFQCEEVQTLMAKGNTQGARTRLVELMQERSAEATFGDSGLDEELEMIRDQFRRFSTEKVLPYAH
ncbi:MAG: acyl-CoA dehydrogenase, partial [Pseudomonadota bacterium]